MVTSQPSATSHPSASVVHETQLRLRNELEDALRSHEERLSELPTQDEISMVIRRRTEDAREEVVAALAPMDEGTYGICESCDALISQVRLDAMPHTRYCMHCAQQQRRPS